MSLTITQLTQHIEGYVNFSFKLENGKNLSFACTFINIFIHYGNEPTVTAAPRSTAKMQYRFVNNL